MVRLDNAISVTRAFDRTGVRDPLLDRYPSRSVYSATIPSFWTIGSVVHGGFLLSLLTRTATTHQSLYHPQHSDPAHLSSQFLSASVAGGAEVEVSVVSVSKRWTRLDVELWQYNDATLPREERDYTLKLTRRTLRIRAHFLFTQLENVFDLETSTPRGDDSVPTYLNRECPILKQPGEIQARQFSEIPAKFGFKAGMRWKEVECEQDGHVPGQGGELRWACWFELTQGEDLTKLADLVPFFADCSKNGPEVLGQTPGFKKPSPSWYPTLTLAMDFKTAFPLPSSVSSTTFGLFASTKSIQAGRHDLTVEVWTSPQDLGAVEGKLDPDWRKKARCVGISTQMALTTTMSFNESKASGGNSSSSSDIKVLFQRLPPSPRPFVNSAFQGDGRIFFSTTANPTSRFRQLADEQLREKKRRARDAANSLNDRVRRPRFALWRTLLWLLVIGNAYSGFQSVRNRRVPFHYHLGRPKLPQTAPGASASVSFVPSTSRQIPPVLHYVFGLHPTFGGKPFSLIYYICMTSALKTIKPDVLYLHYVYLPSGFYWEEFVRNVQDSGHTKLELRKVRDVTEVFGRPVSHYAHKADVIRLEALKEFGGMYLDVDVLVTRDFTPLYRFEAVLGIESQPILEPNLPPSGLCNAVILAKPYAPFITRWLDRYRTFDSNSWAGHSVTLPWQLAQEHPDEVTVLNKYAFFWPLC